MIVGAVAGGGLWACGSCALDWIRDRQDRDRRAKRARDAAAARRAKVGRSFEEVVGGLSAAPFRDSRPVRLPKSPPPVPSSQARTVRTIPPAEPNLFVRRPGLVDGDREGWSS